MSKILSKNNPQYFYFLNSMSDVIHGHTFIFIVYLSAYMHWRYSPVVFIMFMITAPYGGALSVCPHMFIHVCICFTFFFVIHILEVVFKIYDFTKQ